MLMRRAELMALCPQQRVRESKKAAGKKSSKPLELTSNSSTRMGSRQALIKQNNRNQSLAPVGLLPDGCCSARPPACLR